MNSHTHARYRGQLGCRSFEYKSGDASGTGDDARPEMGSSGGDTRREQSLLRENQHTCVQCSSITELLESDNCGCTWCAVAIVEVMRQIGKKLMLYVLLLATAEVVASAAVWHGTPTDWKGPHLDFWSFESSRLLYWCSFCTLFIGLWGVL